MQLRGEEKSWGRGHLQACGNSLVSPSPCVRIIELNRIPTAISTSHSTRAPSGVTQLSHHGQHLHQQQQRPDSGSGSPVAPALLPILSRWKEFGWGRPAPGRETLHTSEGESACAGL